MADRTTGKQQSFTFNSQTIPITKCSPKITRKLADTTDSGDYVTSPDMIFPTQIPVSCPLELAIEGGSHQPDEYPGRGECHSGQRAIPREFRPVGFQL
jgi:hypothetical protein